LAVVPNVSVISITMTFAGKVNPAKQGSDGDAVEYATITIKIPVNRIGSVFGCMRNLHKSDKRLQKISYRKHTKVDYTKCIEPASSSSESLSDGVSETNTDTSRSSIRDMIREEVGKVLSKNDYKKVVPPPKPEPKSVDDKPQLIIQPGHELCDCVCFREKMNKDKAISPNTAHVVRVSNIIRFAKMFASERQNLPCNLKQEGMKITSFKQCDTVKKRLDEEILQAQRMEEDSAPEPFKCSKLEEERFRNRAHRSFVKTMKTSIPSNKEIEEARRIYYNEVKVYGKGMNIARANDLRLYRVDDKFYNAMDFIDIYRGMGWFRKKQWNKNFN